MGSFTQLLTEAAARPDPRLLNQWIGKVHEQDAVEAMNAMPVESVDAIVTSPPCNIKNSTGNGLKCGKGGGLCHVQDKNGAARGSPLTNRDRAVPSGRGCWTGSRPADGAEGQGPDGHGTVTVNSHHRA